MGEHNIMETDLILNHNELVKKLDDEYTNRICKLLQQKSMILENLQHQFIERRNRIKQTFPNKDIINDNGALPLMNDNSSALIINDPKSILSENILSENPITN